MANTTTNLAHHYHCTLSEVPFNLRLPIIADHLRPQTETSNIIRELDSMGAHIMPFQLHMYKEKLPTKFGYVSFMVNLTSNAQYDKEHVHSLVIQWIRQELTPQLHLLHCNVRLAQPPECYSADPFLIALNHLCPLLSPSTNDDNKKLETFLLSKVEFYDDKRNVHFNETHSHHRRTFASSEDMLEDQKSQEVNSHHPHNGEANAINEAYFTGWSEVGTFATSQLTSAELEWLKKEISSFPAHTSKVDANTTAVSNNTTNNNEEKADKKAIHDFFVRGLAPLITVVD